MGIPATSLVTTLGGGKKIVLRFGKDGEANFLIPNAGLALGAAQLCLGCGAPECRLIPAKGSAVPPPHSIGLHASPA